MPQEHMDIQQKVQDAMAYMIGHPSKRTHVVGSLIGKALLTVSLFECNINSSVFNCWVGQDLIPKLPSSSVIVMDNAAFHQNKDLKIMVDKAGNSIEYLPHYSPELNPIEQKWFQAKSRRKQYNCDIDTLFENYIT